MRRRAFGFVSLALVAGCVLTGGLATVTDAAGAKGDFERHIGTGKALYEQGKIDDAIKEFKAAVTLEPDNSMGHLWLGRALGRKTEKANAVQAAFMVGDVRNEFERAVALDPKNLEARSDLMEFYLDAPSTFGGGIDKAQAQAEAMARLDPAEGHWARARIAEKQKHYEVARREYRAAVEADPASKEYQEDLKKFLSAHGSAQAKG